MLVTKFYHAVCVLQQLLPVQLCLQVKNTCKGGTSSSHGLMQSGKVDLLIVINYELKNKPCITV